MLFIITNPHVYKKLQAEIDATPHLDAVVSDERARSLPYLQAVIKEGSRMWPPEGYTIVEKFAPGGTEIEENDWVIQRNKKVYGEDSAVFRPERWLEAQGKQLEMMEKNVGLIFGYGKYGCLGKNVALMQLNKVFRFLLFTIYGCL
jgi:cytochrome P450